MKDKPFTTKDIDKLKKALDKAGAIPITKDTKIEFTPQEWNALMKMSKWADNVLETAEKLNRQCAKN